jgi:class 3 adenylate cyclase
MIVWSLFNDDVRLVASDNADDIVFTSIISTLFFIFIVEIIASAIYKVDYILLPEWSVDPEETAFQRWQKLFQFGSFYFWVDIIATFSLLIEISWIVGTDVDLTGTDGDAPAQASARAGRALRLLRTIRLVRLAKLFKYAHKKRKQESHAVDSNDAYAESNVGAAMSDLTNRRVIVLVLTMLLLIPLLTVQDTDLTYTMSTEFLHATAVLKAMDNATYFTTFQLAYNNMLRETSVVSVMLNGTLFFFDANLDEKLRKNIETSTSRVNTDDYETVVVFDLREESVEQSLYSMYTTLFVMLLLMGGTYFFSRDVDNLVITPIERMVDLVRKISANPLGVEYKMLGEKDGFIEGMETTVLLSTITKIGSLMRVGFGEAGAGVIARNLAESAGGKLNLMSSGTLINSIFGFCDVRQFTDTTECLQEEVMLFVNRIAHILHGIVVQCSGCANKNIGDAFLLTWKLDKSMSNDQKTALADQALVAFLKTLVELIRHEEFICDFSVTSMTRLYKRFPEYNVRIGAGLHVGWAIEGAIGSHRKIDVSYLSPHVNFSEYLESSTKHYGVPLLMSEPFHALLSKDAKHYCRAVDRIRRSMDEPETYLYTYDADLTINFADTTRRRESIPPGGILGGLAGLRGNLLMSQSSRAMSQRLDLLKRSEGEEDEELGLLNFNEMEDAHHAPKIIVAPYSIDVWEEDEDLVELRSRINDHFRIVWAEAIKYYIEGNWSKAKDMLRRTSDMAGDKDGPTNYLRKYIKDHRDTAPKGWRGYRMEGDDH